MFFLVLNPRPDFIVVEHLCVIVLLIVTAPVHGTKTHMMEHANTCSAISMFSVHAFRTRLSLPINRSVSLLSGPVLRT